MHKLVKVSERVGVMKKETTLECKDLIVTNRNTLQAFRDEER